KTSFFFYINGRAYRKFQKMGWMKNSKKKAQIIC
ncbi:hypothetical protein ACFTRA_07810, partial [Bacillus spizizenii]